MHVCMILTVALIPMLFCLLWTIILCSCPCRYDRQEKEKKTKPAVVQLYEVQCNNLINNLYYCLSPMESY